MTKGVNKVIIIGNLGGDPESRTFPDGGQLVSFTVATSESWKDKQTGQQKEVTEWHKITVNGRLAEICAQYLRKGSKVYLEGQLKTRKWADKETGKDRYSTEIVARNMQMLDSRSDASSSSQAGGYQQAPMTSQQMPPVQPAPNTSGYDDFDDDIPF